MLWKEHKANPLDTPGQYLGVSSGICMTCAWQPWRTGDRDAGPDFLSMNKHAAIKGLTSAPQQHKFRVHHPACLKNGEAVKKPAPLLPSDVDTEHVYGMPGTYRTAEQIRNAGSTDPPMKPLIQSQFSNAWVSMNKARAHEFDKRKAYITPKRTKGSAYTSHSPGMPMAMTHTLLCIS